MNLASRLIRSRRTPLVLAAVLGLGGLAWAGNFGYHAIVDPSIRIENASGQELRDLEILWCYWSDGPPQIDGKQLAALGPGETRRLTLPGPRYLAAFSAVADGRRIREDLDGFHIGEQENFIIRIMPGGRVVRGHAHMVNVQAR